MKHLRDLRETFDVTEWPTRHLIVLLTVTVLGLVTVALKGCGPNEGMRWQEKALWEGQVKNSH